MAISINCVHCGKVLKSIQPVPPGTMLTCPQCHQQFESPGESPTAVEEVPAANPVQPPSTDAGRKVLQSVGQQLRRFLEYTRLTAIATAGHLAQFVACLMASGRIRFAQQEAVRQRAALGQKMYQNGLGDADNRRIIDDIERRIRNAESAGQSKRALQRELLAAHAAIAEPPLDSDQAPAALEREFEAARTARNGLLTAQQLVADRRTGLRTMQSSQGLRICVGYACVFLIISSLVWAARGSGTPAAKSNSPDQHENVVDNNGGGNADGGDGAVGDNPDPGLVQNYGSTDQQSMCQNCFGTGQANCIQCAGTGKRSCFMCNGTGRTVNNMQCFQCNGTGRQNCSFCSYGKVQCPQCFGTGKH